MSEKPDRIEQLFIESAGMTLPAFRKAMNQYTQEIIGKCQWLNSTHTEKDGSWCDTGADMDWSCRSECVDMANARLTKIKDSLR